MNKTNTYEIGKVYGMKRLVSIDKINGKTVASVTCVNCGKKSQMRPSDLFHTKHTSCVCATKTIGGLSKTRIYGIYHNMKYRCFNSNANEYENYGGRGITICDEWMSKDGFMKFFEWAAKNGYSDNLTIDRVDVNRDYSPDNCRWVTKSENTAQSNRDNRKQRRKSNYGSYYAKNGDEIIVFDNAKLFAEEHNISAGSVREAARKNKSYKGWTFGYASNLCEKPQSTIESPLNVE